ncbi:MAG: hypothetical protein R3C49_07970 [Planctomycetaceae bacterium]
MLLAATPVGLSAFPSEAHAVSQLRAKAATQAQLALIDAQAEILKGHATEAIRLLTQVADSDLTEPVVREQSTALLNELLLNALAIQQLHPAQDQPDKLPARQQILERLEEQSLNVDQRLRMAVLKPDRESLLRLVGSRPESIPMISMQEDWRVRADVAATIPVLNDQKLPTPAGDPLPLAKALMNRVQRTPGESAPESRRILLENATLAPGQFNGTAEVLEVVDHLVRSGESAAAETLLLSATVTDRNRQLFERLDQVRSPGRPTIPTLTSTQKLPAPKTPGTKPALTQKDITFTEQVFLHSTNRIAELLNASYTPVDTPAWFADRLITGNRNLFTVNMATGAVSVPYQLPASPEQLLIADDPETPGLLPVVGADHVGMVSLVGRDRPQLLWWKRWLRPVEDLVSPETGPLGPGFLIVTTGSRISCVHPLTGRLLWERSLPGRPVGRGILYDSIRFAGDHQVIGVFGSELASCAVYRTDNGAFVHNQPLDIPSGETPIVSGRHILYPVDGTLKLIDLLNGRDLLSTSSLRVLDGAHARLVAGQRAVLLSEDLEIVLLDLKSGEIPLRYRAASKLEGQNIAGLSAIEQQGRLYVVIKDFGDPYSEQSASSRMNDFRVDSGTLFCIDLQTKAMWGHKTKPAVLMPVHGDPTDLILKWSWQNPGNRWERRLGSASSETDERRALNITIHDGTTGAKLAEVTDLSDSEPLRCVHDADRKTILVDTDSSVIEISYHSAGGSSR